MNVLVTGSTGFLGKPLLNELSSAKFKVFPVVRGASKSGLNYNTVFVSGIDSKTNWQNYLVNKDVVIHCAARVHVMNDNVSDPLDAFRDVNVLGTMNLAHTAAQAGVKRFIFISSIKVNGESTTGLPTYLSSNKPSPKDPYGISKAEAEEQLLALGNKTGMEIVIIRPPLVYGPGVKANFAAICKLTAKGLPLPFASLVTNKRSMVYVENLISLIVECVTNKSAANNVFLVSDNDDLSLADFIKRLSLAMGKKALLLPCPKFLFELVGRLTGKTAVVDRLVGSLQVDTTDTCKTLNWTPPYTVEDGFKETVKDFKK
ncbi:MAG: UDP-glucose 4-epimerase [Colwellia sp.]|jgi:UDP-glucose 4-epimerase